MGKEEGAFRSTRWEQEGVSEGMREMISKLSKNSSVWKDVKGSPGSGNSTSKGTGVRDADEVRTTSSSVQSARPAT